MLLQSFDGFIMNDWFSTEPAVYMCICMVMPWDDAIPIYDTLHLS